MSRAVWRTFKAISVSIVLLQAAGVHAQPASVPQSALRTATNERADEELILTVRANGVERGEFTLLRKSNGDYWVAAEDLPKLRLEPLEQARRQVGAQWYYSFEALGAGSRVLDEPTLTLSVDFATRNISGTRIDLSARTPSAPPSKPETSLIWGYRLAGRSSDSGGGTGSATHFSLENDLNVRFGGLLFRQESKVDTSAPQRRFSRGVSQVIWDKRSTGTRLVVGDTLSSAGTFGSVISGAGISFSRLFDLTPDVLKQPTATLQTSSALPAEVELAVDGSPIFRTRVGPGPISLDNLLLYGGTRNLRVTVTDMAGHREVIERPFLFTDAVLSQGLHDFNYFVGKRSDFRADGTWRYGEGAWQGFHRYGLTDAITVAAGGEGSSRLLNGGLGATVRHDRLGLLSLDVLASMDRERQTSARGWSVRYTYLVPDGSFQAGRRQFGDDFRTFTTSANAPFLKQESRIAASTRLFAGTIGGELVRSVTALEDRKGKTLRYSMRIGRSATLSAEYEVSRTNGQRDFAANVFVRFDLGAQRWVGTSARGTSKFRTIDVDAGKQLGQGEGLGYRVGVSSNAQGNHDNAYGFAALNWNLRPASIEIFGMSDLRSSGGRYGEAALAGSLVGIDGHWGLTRRVHDSFVLARLGVPQAGVEVSVNNQVQGRTDREGVLLIPQVGAFGRQDVSVNDKQIGMQYNLRERRMTVAPAHRSGTTVDFGGRKVSAVAGMAWEVRQRERVPIAARTWTMRGAAGTLVIETSSSGDFYLEDVSAGTYLGALDSDGKQRACRLVIPEFSDIVHELKEGIICD